MIETAEVSLPLRQGTTVEYELVIEADDPSLALDTVAEWRAHLRETQTGTPLLELSSLGPATVEGSELIVMEATPSLVRLRYRIAPGDSAALPYNVQLGSDLEMEYPSGDVARPARVRWLTDGEWTHG